MKVKGRLNDQIGIVKKVAGKWDNRSYMQTITCVRSYKKNRSNNQIIMFSKYI